MDTVNDILSFRRDNDASDLAAMNARRATLSFEVESNPGLIGALEEIEEDIRQRQLSIDRGKLRDAEALQRALVGEREELAELKARLFDERDDCWACVVVIQSRLDSTPAIEHGPLVAEGVTFACQYYWLADELRIAGGAPPPRRPISDLFDRAPQAWAAFWARCGCRFPPVPKPWAADMARLRELIEKHGPPSRIGNGG